MRLVKRSRYLFVSIDDVLLPDLEAFLRGEIEIQAHPRIQALSPLTASTRSLSEAEFLLLANLRSDDWCPVSEVVKTASVDQATVEDLARSGLLVSDTEEDPELALLRRREEQFSDAKWHPNAALHHFMSRNQETASEPRRIDLAALSESVAEDAAAFLERHGPPPAAFYETAAGGDRLDLPLIEMEGPLYETLLERQTTRSFHSERATSLEDFTTLLRYVFGCHGTCRLAAGVTLLRKTSPSGGSLHPIEAYPLILNVEGVAPGLYHYDVSSHSLRSIRYLDPAAARQLAQNFCSGQLYAESAHALVILAARWYRNYWKYRLRSRTYGVVLKDAGHLSQTFYLVATDLGLGAFYTAAIDGPLIEESLGLEAVEESAIGVCGCGVIAKGGATLGLEFEPFVPRRESH